MKVLVLCVVIAAVLFEESNRRVGGATVTDKDAAVSLRKISLNEVGEYSDKEERKRWNHEKRGKKGKKGSSGGSSSPGSSESHESSEGESVMEHLIAAIEQLEAKCEKIETLLDNIPEPAPCPTTTTTTTSTTSTTTTTTPPIPGPCLNTIEQSPYTLRKPLFYAKFCENPSLVVALGAEQITTERDFAYSFGGTASNQDYLEIPLLADSCVFNNNCENGYAISSRIKIQHCGGNGIGYYESNLGSGCIAVQTSFPDDTWFRATMSYNKEDDETSLFVDYSLVTTFPGRLTNMQISGFDAQIFYQRSSSATPVFGAFYYDVGLATGWAFLRFQADDLIIWGEPLHEDDVVQFADTPIPYPGDVGAPTHVAG